MNAELLEKITKVHELDCMAGFAVDLAMLLGGGDKPGFFEIEHGAGEQGRVG